MQNSVFELLITSGDLKLLECKLEGMIDKEVDSIRIYKLGKEKNVAVDIIGKRELVEISSDSSILL